MDAVIALLWAFHAESSIAEACRPDEPYVRGLLSDVASSCAKRGLVVVAEREGSVVGAAAVMSNGIWCAPEFRAAIEMFVYVDRAHRVGIGRGLVKALEAYLTCYRYARLYLMTEAANPRAGKLFERMGYAPSGAMFCKELGV